MYKFIAAISLLALLIGSGCDKQKQTYTPRYIAPAPRPSTPAPCTLSANERKGAFSTAIKKALVCDSGNQVLGASATLVTSRGGNYWRFEGEYSGRHRFWGRYTGDIEGEGYISDFVVHLTSLNYKNPGGSGRVYATCF